MAGMAGVPWGWGVGSGGLEDTADPEAEAAGLLYLGMDMGTALPNWVGPLGPLGPRANDDAWPCRPLFDGLESVAPIASRVVTTCGTDNPFSADVYAFLSKAGDAGGVRRTGQGRWAKAAVEVHVEEVFVKESAG